MSIRKDEVVWCYRVLLGREPESELMVRAHMKTDTFANLRDLFLRSPEFEKQLARIRTATPRGPTPFPSLELPPNPVDTEATEQQLAACIAAIKRAWTHLGLERPHFSVLTSQQFLPENLQGSMDAFWDSGEMEAAGALRILARHGLSSTWDKICVEYGCGVGRVTMGFSSRFTLVHGYDISPGHLACATQRAQDIGAKNAIFHQCSEHVLEDIQECDFFYSRLVFQHNPPPIIVRLIENALRALKTNGIAMFQVPTWSDGYQFKLLEWLDSDHAPDMQMHCLPQEIIFEIIAQERCLTLSVREDDSPGASGQFISNTFIVRKCKS